MKEDFKRSLFVVGRRDGEQKRQFSHAGQIKIIL
jgi:hypothetical protein